MRRQPAPQRVIRKRSFLLFELLISMALLTLCLFPLIQSHAGMRAAERKRLVDVQLTTLAQEAFCLLKEELYENNITWDALELGCQGSLDDDFVVIVGKDAKKKFNCRYTIEQLNQTRKKDNRVGLVVEIDLHFLPGDRHFQRTLFLERHSL